MGYASKKYSKLECLSVSLLCKNTKLSAATATKTTGNVSDDPSHFPNRKPTYLKFEVKYFHNYKYTKHS